MATVLMVNAGPPQHGEGADDFRRVPLWIEIHGLSRALDSVPLTVTVAVPPEAAGFLTATVRPAKVKGEEADCDFAVTLPPETDSDYPLTVATTLDHFNCESFASWKSLLDGVERWLLTTVLHRTHPQWSWGVSLYWMAFVGTYPDFPAGPNWPDWNTGIPFEGSFLDSWMARFKPKRAPGPAQKLLPEPVAARTREEIRRDVWTEIQGQLALYNCTLI
ncbi:hypothetical protein BC835DRAFT_1531383 [Cytidiella melzeri]|nr:hypothetical protein BC835DRAFT_1531383 [Cytidiella melzeri]